MKKALALLAAVVAVLAIGVVPASSITDGQLDGQGHPYVGLMIAKNAAGNPLWRCSGALLGPELFLTAGHCTESPAASVEIWFAAGPIPQDPNYVPVAAGGTGCANVAVTGYPCRGDVSGTPHTHPEYDPSRFFVRDLGAVVLDEPFVTGQYGALPQLNELDRLQTRRGQQDRTFTAVGYGLQRINPVFIEAERVRMFSRPRLIQINVPGFTGDFSLLLSNNAATGGTCFGDSGGPNLIGTSNVIGGVTSFGLNGNCAGTGGVFRVDRSWSLNWLQTDFGHLLP